jgi:hypothetical protein
MVLLDLPEADDVPGKPITAGGRHRAPGSAWSDRRRIVGVAGAVLIAVVGSVVGGSLAMRSHPPAARGGVSDIQGVAPKIVVVQAVPSTHQASRVATRVHHPRRSRPPAEPSVSAPASPSASPTHKASPPPPAIAVTYRVINNWHSGFQAAIDVTNNGSKPISGWWNATGYASNGVLLLAQPSWGGTLRPHGAKWSAYFNANGTQTTPTACAFNGITCGGT